MGLLCYSARFITPFAQVLATYDGYDATALDKLRAIDPESRIPATSANELAVQQVADTGDEDLGFKAARAMPLGRAGALDYAMRSAATLRGAVEVGDRYIRAFSDVLRLRLDVEEGRACVRMESSVPVPRAIIDFTMTAWFENHLRAVIGAAGFECWFPFRRPARTDEYERHFAPGDLRFDAPAAAFVFDRGCLDAPLTTADPGVHAVLCEHVALGLVELDGRPSFAGRVRAIAARGFEGGGPASEDVARELRMSARTLARRLEREGTSFSALVDDLRRELALRYVANHDLSLGEIAFLVGFAHVEAFHRAFRRWTGSTPRAYRLGRGGGALPPYAKSATLTRRAIESEKARDLVSPE